MPSLDTFPFESRFPPRPEDKDLESFTGFNERLDNEGARQESPILPCETPYIEISLIDATRLTPEPGARYKLRDDTGQEFEGPLGEDGVARIEDAKLDLQGKSLRVTYFADAEKGATYLIELESAPESQDDTPEEPQDALYFNPIPWLPFGRPSDAADAEAEDEDAEDTAD